MKTHATAAGMIHIHKNLILLLAAAPVAALLVGSAASSVGPVIN